MNWPRVRAGRHKISVTSALFKTIFQMLLQKTCAAVPDFDEEVDVEEGLGQPSGDEDLPHEPEQTGTELDESFQPEDADNLSRIIGDMCAATPSILSVTMPWELPGISLVLGDETPIVPTPVLHPGLVLEDEPPIVSESHRTARVDRIRGSFHECIDFKLTLALRNSFSTLGQSFGSGTSSLHEDEVGGLRGTTYMT